MRASQRLRERVERGKRTSQAALASGLTERLVDQYLDEGLQTAVKQLTVKNGARSILPHSAGLRGESGGPGETARIHGGYGDRSSIQNKFKPP